MVFNFLLDILFLLLLLRKKNTASYFEIQIQGYNMSLELINSEMS